MKKRLERLVAAMSDPDASFLRQCRKVRDWEHGLDSAFEQGVAGVLLHRIESVGFAVPAQALEAARRRLALDRLWHRRLCADLRRVLRAFGQSGLRAVVLKGPVLAERLYPEASLRASGDLDLLVCPAGLARARGVLERIGYSERPGPSPFHAVVFDRTGSGTVDLHHCASDGFGTTLEAEGLVDRSGAYRTEGGETAWIFSPEDEFLYLAVHAARHRFLRLRWLYDLKLFLRHHPDLSWETIGARARSFGVRRAVAASSEMLERRLKVDLPKPAKPLLRRNDLRLRAALVAARLSAVGTGGIWIRTYRVFWHLTYHAFLGEGMAAGAAFWWHSLARAAGKLRKEIVG